MTENSKKNNISRQDRDGRLRGLKKKIMIRAALIVVTVLLAAVLLFSLTAAWFVNVVGTSGLSFVAKKWDFNGEIRVDSSGIDMAPGESGIVEMSISNDGEETAFASVTVSKEKLSETEMQKRLFFYVDTPFYRNGERMDKVYVTSLGGYTYTVFPQSSVEINENTQNAPALRWEWVYDVLGYYVLGSVSDSGEATVKEFLRPIEYDYDPAFTTFDKQGKLLSVDGSTGVEDFLLDLSSNDGYSGSIDVSAVNNGYYPVSVNSEGYGVWAYLCTYEEIVANSEYDTQIGSQAESLSHVVEIYVTGSSGNDRALEVSDKDMLISVLESTSYASVKLTDDLTLDSQIVMQSGYRADIDLNGHTLSLSGESDSTSVIKAEMGSSVTLHNGTIDATAKKEAILSDGAEVTLDRVKISGAEYGVNISDNSNGSGADSRVHVVDSTVNGTQYAVRLFANEGASNTKTTLIIERSTLIGSGYGGIVCSGNYEGSDIQISDSSVSGYYCAIYHPQKNSTMTLTNSSFEGWTGIVVKGGTVNITDCRVRGTGEYNEPAPSLSGWTDTGDGIYLEANYDWKAEINIFGDNTDVTSANALAVRKYPEDDPDSAIRISGGTYSTSVYEYLADSTVTETETKAEGTETTVFVVSKIQS